MDEFKRVRSVTDRESGQTYIIGLTSGRIFFQAVYSWSFSWQKTQTVSDVWFVVLPIIGISSK